MLKKLILPTNLKLLFCLILHNKSLIINIKGTPFFYYVAIPVHIKINLIDQMVFLSFKEDKKSLADLFIKSLESFIQGLRLINKKTLLFRGLGLKISTDLNSDSLLLKVGLSHDILFDVNKSAFKLLTGKKYLTLFSYNKVKLGNLAQQLYKIKKANCFKNRGFFYKNRPLLLKAIKKT